MKTIFDMMLEYGADGVDFVPIWFDDIKCRPVYCSYTVDDFKSGRVCGIPKSNYVFWKIVSEEKVYIETK